METKIEPDEPVQKVIPPCDTCAVLPGSIYCDTCQLKETRKKTANRERPKKASKQAKNCLNMVTKGQPDAPSAWSASKRYGKKPRTIIRVETVDSIDLNPVDSSGKPRNACYLDDCPLYLKISGRDCKVEVG